MARITRLLTGLVVIWGLAWTGSAIAMRAGGGHAVAKPITTVATKHGMRLVLRLKSDAYPKNALVPVTLSLTNISGRSAYLYDCPSDSLTGVVRDGKGRDLYPNLLPPPGAPWPICPGRPAMGDMPHHGMVVPAGTTVKRMTYVVLRALAIRGLALFDFSRIPGPPIALLTPRIHLQAVSMPGPVVRIEKEHPSQADVMPVSGGAQVEYSQYVSCARRARGNSFAVDAAATISRWMRAPGKTILAPCTGVEEWYLFVGQPGLPIAHAYYCRRHDRCVYAPPTARERAIATCKIDVAKALENGRLPRSAARYAIGLSSTLPRGLTPTQQALAERFHDRCASLLKFKP